MAKKPTLPRDYVYSKETIESMGSIALNGMTAGTSTRFRMERDIPLESYEGNRYGWESPSAELMLCPRGYFYTDEQWARADPEPKRAVLCRFCRTCPALTQDGLFFVDGCEDLPGKGKAVYVVFPQVPVGTVVVAPRYIEYFDAERQTWRPSKEWSGSSPDTIPTARSPDLPREYFYRMEFPGVVPAIAREGFEASRASCLGTVDGVPYESFAAAANGWRIPPPEWILSPRVYLYSDILRATRRGDSEFLTLCRISRSHPALADDSRIFVDGRDDVRGEGRVLYAVFPHAQAGQVVIEPNFIEYFDRKHRLWRSMASLGNVPTVIAAGWAQELDRYHDALTQGVKNAQFPFFGAARRGRTT